MKWWVNVISKDHALAGIKDGFVQASHGSAASLQLLRAQDLIFFYSPGTLFRAGEILQSFTAVARVAEGEACQVESPAKTRSWRRKVTPLPCEEVPIEPLIPHLDFIQDRANWALSLRRGLFEIGEDDARRIADAMKADVEH